MSTAIEIENAIRGLPTTEAQAVAKWLQDYLARKAATPTPIAADIFVKWRGRGRLPVGRNTDEYLQLTRNGNGS